jgi:hypothetical protein
LDENIDQDRNEQGINQDSSVEMFEGGRKEGQMRKNRRSVGNNQSDSEEFSEEGESSEEEYESSSEHSDKTPRAKKGTSES